MADQTLLPLAKEIRGKTLRILEGVDEQQARYAAPGLNNTILWQGGPRRQHSPGNRYP
jgi:hypothetical protein